VVQEIAQMTRSKFLLLSFAVTVFVTALALAAYRFLVDGSVTASGTADKPGRALVQAAINKRIEESSQKSLAAITNRSNEFRTFVQERKAGAKPFSEEVVSIYGKWRVLKSKLPLTDSEGHKKYIVDQFDKHIFTPQQLSDRVKTIIEDSIRDLDQEQNNLAVAIRKELLGRPLMPGEIPVAREELTNAIDRAVFTAQVDAAKGATGLVVAEVTASVASQVLTRLGVSAGILSAGAATSWWTLGAGLAIGFAVNELWDWIDDPAGDIKREIEGSLDNLAMKGSDAIREEMIKVVTSRRMLWQGAAEGMQ
jgi:hypothetical protein